MVAGLGHVLRVMVYAGACDQLIVVLDGRSSCLGMLRRYGTWLVDYMLIPSNRHEAAPYLRLGQGIGIYST